MNEICGIPCPEHGEPCSVVEMDKEDTDIARAIFGPQLNQGPHIHLCVSGKPHSWGAE